MAGKNWVCRKMKLNLPYPVSNNENTRMFNGRILTSKPAKAYKADIGWIARVAKCPMLDGDVSLTVFLHPKMNLDGTANKNRQDLDNIFKILLDGLNGIAWKDDKQITRIYAAVSTPVKNGGLTVIIESCEQIVMVA